MSMVMAAANGFMPQVMESQVLDLWPLHGTTVCVLKAI